VSAVTPSLRHTCLTAEGKGWKCSNQTDAPINPNLLCISHHKVNAVAVRVCGTAVFGKQADLNLLNW
ncbi:MAG: hypothetical protein IKI93_17335, partial [Clostridia bacterium]|nr:hypothetical protein [Clostridia bacterium]